MTYVYIVTPNGDEFPCKVGISDNPASRLASLQTGSANMLALREVYWLDTRGEALKYEQAFHQAHAEHRMNSEWFGLNFADANFWLFDNVIGPALRGVLH